MPNRSHHISKKNGHPICHWGRVKRDFLHPKYHEGKAVSLDFLGYQFDPNNKQLQIKLEIMAKYREERAAKILNNLNTEFKKENISALTTDDLETD